MIRTAAIMALLVLVFSSVCMGAEKEFDCDHCEDTGKIDCPKCKEDDLFWCSECAGTRSCPVCHGLGWILCPECGGRDAKAERDFLLEERRKHEEVSEAVGTRLRCIETARFRLLTDIDHRKSHRYAWLLENYAERFNVTFGNDPEEKVWSGRCNVYLFQPRDAFVKFAALVDGKPEIASSGGYSCPAPGGPLVVLFKESRSEADTLRTIIHELAHVYLNAYYAHGELPVWVHEGVAQEFEFTYEPETSRRAESWRRLNDAQETNTLMTLSELAEMNFSHAELLPYAASWSAVNFLMSRDKRAFVKWAKLIKDGADQQEAFREAFGVPMALAGRTWHRYIPRQK